MNPVECTAFAPGKLILLSVYLCLLPAIPALSQQEPDGNIPFEQAVYETLQWAWEGYHSESEINELYDRIERSAYRYGIEPEFGLCVVAAEARLGEQISWARYDTWSTYERVTETKLSKYPLVFDDLDSTFSELREVLRNSGTINEVLGKYWSGPAGEFNADSRELYIELVSKLFNGFETYRQARIAELERQKYSPEYYDRERLSENWAGLAFGNLEGYSSKMGSMPELAKNLKTYPEDEQDYASVIRGYNKRLTHDESIVIARAILTYCEQTEWLVDPRFVVALVRAESAFNPRARSKVGALGLGQLMPATAKSHGIRDPFDPIQNLYGCVKYLEREMNRWKGHGNQLDLVMASYNAGPGAVIKYNGIPPYRETRNFVATVNKYYRQLAPEKYQQ